MDVQYHVRQLPPQCGEAGYRRGGGRRRGAPSLPLGARADAKGNVEFFSAGDGVVWRAWLDSGLVSELAGTAYGGAEAPRVVK